MNIEHSDKCLVLHALRTLKIKYESFSIDCYTPSLPSCIDDIDTSEHWNNEVAVVQQLIIKFEDL